MGCERPRSRRGQPEPSTKSGGSKGHHAPRPSNGGPSRAQHPTISRAVEPHRHSVDATTVIPVDRNEPLTRERVDNATMSASQVETVVPLAVDPVDFRALIAELVGASVATGSATLALVVWVLENIGYWTGRFVLSYKSESIRYVAHPFIHSFIRTSY